MTSNKEVSKMGEKNFKLIICIDMDDIGLEIQAQL